MDKEERRAIANALNEWFNSIHDLHSDSLSSIGVDDMGDLASASETFFGWTDRFFNLKIEIEDGLYAPQAFSD